MPRLRANVVALTRPTSAMTTGQALVTPAYSATRLGAAPVQQGDLISARVRAGRLPPPMSRVWVECHSPSDWEVVDTVTPATAVLHDDFLQIYYNAGILSADTTWGVNDSTGGLGTVTQGGVGFGVVQIRTGATNLNSMSVQKDAGSLTLDADTALWHSYRMKSTNATNITTYNGFDDGLGNLCYIKYDSSVDTTYKLATNGGVTTVDLNIAPSASGSNNFDIVMMPGQWAAAWVDGDGPYVSTTGIPAAGVTPRIIHAVATLTNATRLEQVDWTHVESFLDPAHPTLLYS